MRVFLPCLALLFSFLSGALAADYHEQLVLRPLPLSALLASFNFRSNSSLDAFEAHNYRFFPRSLAQILQHSGTRELHLRFSLGRWDAESWGARPWDGKREGGTGVELWAWLDAETDEEADRKWLVLTNALSGLFCASLNFIDGTRTTRPAMSFRPEGHHPQSSLENMQLLHGVLPREVVCTENLTPFLKLLPCKGKAGIASLLDGHKLFDASWQTMAIDVRPVCVDGECVLQMEQTVDMVLDIERSKRPRENPIPHPVAAHDLKCNTSKPYHSDDTCFAMEYNANEEWSLKQVFGRPMRGTCPLDHLGVPPVCLQVPESRPVYVSEGVAEKRTAGSSWRCYEIQAHAEAEILLPRLTGEDEAQTQAVLMPKAPSLYAERSLTGYGQERGGVQTILTNPNAEEAVDFVYMESLPWFMRIHLHTLQVRLGDQQRKHDPLIQHVYYRPALDRARGTQLEVRIRLPPASTAFLSYDFEKTILRYTEYPPDANRGFDVAAAVITVLDTRGGAAFPLSTSTIRTTPLLLSLPTPDFSMPYNVIIFTSTAIALAFGGMFNILVRRFVAADEGPDSGLASLVAKMVARLRPGPSKLTKTE